MQLLVDGSDSNTASIAMGYAESVTRNIRWQVQRGGEQSQAGGGVPAPPVDAQYARLV